MLYLIFMQNIIYYNNNGYNEISFTSNKELFKSENNNLFYKNKIRICKMYFAYSYL